MLTLVAQMNVWTEEVHGSSVELNCLIYSLAHRPYLPEKTEGVYERLA